MYTPLISVRQNKLDGNAWYHGKLDRDEAIKRLKKSGNKEG